MECKLSGQTDKGAAAGGTPRDGAVEHSGQRAGGAVCCSFLTREVLEYVTFKKNSEHI